MLIIGEKLNSSVPRTLDALRAHDEAYFIHLIRAQEEAGADYIDINTALTEAREVPDMKWGVDLILRHSDCGIMLDSPNPDVIRAVLPAAKERKLFINSISLDQKYEPLYEVIAQSGACTVCLPISGSSIPQTAQERLSNAEKITEKLISAGVPKENIYLDVLVEAAATDIHAPATALDTIRLIKKELGVNTICGLSNVSFGLPKRRALNTAFLAMAMAAGLDSALLDITSAGIREMLAAANALLGKDEYCMDYISFMRNLP